MSLNISFEEAIALDKNLYHIDDESFTEKLRLSVRELISSLFDDRGNYITKNFDAHRNYRGECNEVDQQWKKDCARMHDFLFDDNGNLREIVKHQLPFVIYERNFPWDCKAVHLHYANMHGEQTSGSYPATWMDK